MDKAGRVTSIAVGSGLIGVTLDKGGYLMTNLATRADGTLYVPDPAESLKENIERIQEEGSGPQAQQTDHEKSATKAGRTAADKSPR